MLDVLTDIPGKTGRFWGDHTTLVGPAKPPSRLLKWAGNRWAHNLTGCIAGLRLFALRDRCHGVVTDGGSSGMLFAWLQALCPWGRKPHVMIDCLWNRSPNPLAHWLKKVRVHLAARSVERFVVWSSHEVEDFAQAFDLPREKLQFVPFHTTLHDYDLRSPRRRLYLRRRQFGSRLSHIGRSGSASRGADVDRHDAAGFAQRRRSSE